MAVKGSEMETNNCWIGKEHKDPDRRKKQNKARCRKMFEQLPSETRRLKGGSKGWGYIDGPIYHWGIYTYTG